MVQILPPAPLSPARAHAPPPPVPGFCGYFASTRDADGFTAVERMTSALNRTPSSDRSVHGVSALGLTTGWVSCPIHPTVTVASSADRNLTLILSGELFPSDRSTIETAPALLDAYGREGIACLSRLNGWFSGALIDLREPRAILFNDRYGLGRVYVSESADGLLFSSEAKAILKVRAETRHLDPTGAAEWLSCGCALQNRTLFSGISLLPPGSIWTFNADGTTTKSRYFTPETWENQPKLAAADFQAQLRGVFPRVLRRYFGGGRPIAMSLTGGLDGRMIMAWSPRSAGELPCYTFNGPIRDCADVMIARRIAASCGQPHRTIPLDEPFFPAFTELARRAVFITDGAMDVTGAAELYVNALARGIAPVRLTGNYGSETVRGHVAFRPRGFPEDVLSGEIRRQIATAADTYAREATGNRLAFIAFKQVPWHHFARFAVERSQLTIRSPFLDNDLLALLFRAPASVATSLTPSLRLIAEGNPKLGQIPTDRGIEFDQAGVTRSRTRAVHEFLAKAEYAYDYGMPDWLARMDRWLSPLQLERLFLGRQKFCHFRSWYRQPLAPQIKEVLLDRNARTRPHIGGAGLETMLNDHIAGRSNHTLAIHKLLSLELVHRELLAGCV